MRTARLTVEGELVDHLDADRAAGRFEVEFELPVGVRDLVQSVGIPHVEVKRVIVDGSEVGWDRRIDDGAKIEASARYPLQEPAPDPRFLLDVHLGKLARLLRLLGIDAAYETDADDDELASRSVAEHRILLTRDRRLLMRAALDQGRWVRSTDPATQAAEIIRAFGLVDRVEPFSRCMACGGTLAPAEPSQGEVPAGVLERHSDFKRCRCCHHLFWPGSHHRRLEATMARILAMVEV
jgi:uncharacterized protein with PIN domain